MWRKAGVVILLSLALLFTPPLLKGEPIWEKARRARELVQEAMLHMLDIDEPMGMLQQARELWLEGDREGAEAQLDEAILILEDMVAQAEAKAEERRSEPLDNPFGSLGLTAPSEGLEVAWVRNTALWSEIEPEPGVYYWENSWLDEAQAMGFHQLVVFRIGKFWATGASPSQEVEVPPDEVPPEKEGISYPPLDLSSEFDPQFGHSPSLYQFVYALVSRYKPNIKILTVENEINAPNFWAGTPEEYILVLRTAYKAAHDADPQILVTDSGYASLMWGVLMAKTKAEEGEDPLEVCNFLKEYYGAFPEWEEKLPQSPRELKMFFEYPQIISMVEKAEYLLDNYPGNVDVINFHFHEDSKLLPQVVAWLQEEMRKRGYEYPIICDELGIRKEVPPSDDELAIEIFKTLTRAVASPLKSFFFFPYDTQEKQVGIFQPDGSLKPLPLISFNLLSQTLKGKYTLAAMDSLPGGAEIYFFQDKETLKEDLIALWTEGENVQVNLALPPGCHSVIMTNYRGEAVELIPSGDVLEVNAGPEPALLKLIF